jgi:uncharacterized protein (TIGR00730 family)
MKRICVYCGSSSGARESYSLAAKSLGESLVHRGIGLVYGGSDVGLMRIVSDTVLAGGGEVIGVIPESLVAREVAHRGLSDLRIVRSMHERKATMADLADGFIALPGGFGTLEEFAEIVTWVMLGLHRKPCGLLNVDGYFDGLLSFFNHAAVEGFIRAEYRSIVLTGPEAENLLDQMETYQAPVLPRWVDRDET